MLALGGALAACALLAACGGSGSPSASNAAAREQAEEQKAETKFADYARCLREHGVEAEAISHPGGAHGLKIGPGRAGSPQGVEAAEKACARYRPPAQKGNPSPQQKVEIEEHVQRFVKCMREHGVHVEAAGLGRIRIGGKFGQVNPESPAFQKAQQACQMLLPGGGPKGPPARSG